MVDLILSQANYYHNVDGYEKATALEIAISDNQFWLNEHPDKAELLINELYRKFK